MFGLAGTLKSQVPFFKKDPVVEGLVNRMHYRLTVAILFLSCLLVTCLEWVANGYKINCVMEGAEDTWTIPTGVINTFCYIMSTFTLPKHWHSKIGHEVAHPGVSAYSPSMNYEDDRGEVDYQAYYQWVPFVLLFQGLLFMVPHILFKHWEGGKTRNIISGLNQLILDKKVRSERQKTLASYISDSLHTHNFWALKMLFVDFLNLINVVAQIFFVDIFLQGEFSTYGVNVVKFLEADPENRIDPMATVFPRVTKCTFRKFGPSGTVQTHDAICVLPINIMNEKVYVFLWFWFTFLAFVTIFGLIYHIMTLITPSMTKAYVVSRTMNQRDLNLGDISKFFELGDWKLLSILGANMEPLVFGEFLRELALVLNEKEEAKRKKIASAAIAAGIVNGVKSGPASVSGRKSNMS